MPSRCRSSGRVGGQQSARAALPEGTSTRTALQGSALPENRREALAPGLALCSHGHGMLHDHKERAVPKAFQPGLTLDL